MTPMIRTRTADGVIYYAVEQRTNHFRRVGNEWWRDCVIRFADGRRALAAVPPSVAA